MSNFKKNYAVWFVEHSSRELDVACAVSVLVKNKYGKEIKILPYQKLKLERSNPQLVLLPYCYSFHDRVLQHYLRLWKTSVYFNLAWEQIFYKANLEYKLPRDNFAQKNVIHHCWSIDRAAFLKKRGVPRSHLFINGHPSYKLYDLPYNKVYMKRKDLAQRYGLDTKKRWIFFPENYSWFFYTDYNLEEIIKNGQDRQTVYLMRDYCGKAFKMVINWMNEAINKHGKRIEIILRPRPAFGLSYFNKVLRRLNPTLENQVHIIKDLSVREWILSSDLVVSSFSTSLIEAAVAKKPCFMLEPLKIPQALEASWYAFVKRIQSNNEFLDLCSTARSASVDLSRWAKKIFFVNKDPIMSLADFIGKFDGARSGYTNIDFEKNNWQGLEKAFINLLGNLKRIATKESEYHSTEARSAFEKEAEKRIKDFQKIL